MPDLKENISYQDLSGAISPMLQASKEIGASVSNARRRSKKAVDVSQYKDFTSTLGQYSGGQTGTANSTPASISNLGTTTTNFGGQTRYEGYHPGIDVANKIGTPIPAFAGGTVTSVVSGKQQGDKGFGNTMTVVDDQGREWRYSHLASEYVPVGSKVTQGQTIASMGNSGSTYSNTGNTGSHLDIRIKDLYGKYINPTSIISS